MELNFTVDNRRLRQFQAEADAASAAVKAASERLKTARLYAQDALTALDKARAARAALGRYLDAEYDAEVKAKADARIEAARTEYENRLNEISDLMRIEADRRAVSNAAITVSKSCSEHAARLGIR